MKDTLKDFYGRTVKVGDKVILLYKQRGFRGIDDAYLIERKYLGKGQWGYEFDNKRFNAWYPVIRVKEPEVILCATVGK